MHFLKKVPVASLESGCEKMARKLSEVHPNTSGAFPCFNFCNALPMVLESIMVATMGSDIKPGPNGSGSCLSQPLVSELFVNLAVASSHSI